MHVVSGYQEVPNHFAIGGKLPYARRREASWNCERQTALEQVRTRTAGAQSGPNRELLRREERDAVLLLTLNRPDARNCLSEDVIAALHAAIKEAGTSHSVRAVVLTGAGSAFSSGHDLKELTAHRNDPDRGRAYFAKIMTACSDLMLSIVRCPKPVIAAVNGIATAAGCQLVAACDLAVASTEARFATPGVNIGLFCSTPMVALSRNLSRKAAMEMLLLGDMVDAEQAKELGLVNRVVKADETVNEAVELGRRVVVSEKGRHAAHEDFFSAKAKAQPLAARRRSSSVLRPE